MRAERTICLPERSSRSWTFRDPCDGSFWPFRGPANTRMEPLKHSRRAAHSQTLGSITIGTEERLLKIRRKNSLSAGRGSILCAFFLLILVPVPASAQITTGTSSAGLFYEASGAGEAVVLIHAFSVDRRMWAPQITALEGRFNVIRYDLRGHGKSEGPLAPYAPYEDLRSVLDALAISRATLIG